MPVYTAKTLDDRRHLCELPATLDGKPAKISGAKEGHAMVFQLDHPAYGVPFAWPVVADVMSAGGDFRG